MNPDTKQPASPPLPARDGYEFTHYFSYRPLTPHRCPVCDGHGIVPGGYYNVTKEVLHWTTTNASESCRACAGSGVIYS